MGATENVGFHAEVQWNLGLDFVTNSTDHCKNFNQFTVQCDMLTHVNFPTFAVADPHYGWLILSWNNGRSMNLLSCCCIWVTRRQISTVTEFVSIFILDVEAWSCGSANGGYGSDAWRIC